MQYQQQQQQQQQHGPTLLLPASDVAVPLPIEPPLLAAMQLQIQIRRLRSSTNAGLDHHFGQHNMLNLQTTLVIEPPSGLVAPPHPTVKMWPNMVLVGRDGVAIPGGCQWGNLPTGARCRPWPASFEYPWAAVIESAAAAGYRTEQSAPLTRLVFKLKRPVNGSSGGGGGGMACCGARPTRKRDVVATACGPVPTMCSVTGHNDGGFVGWLPMQTSGGRTRYANSGGSAASLEIEVSIQLVSRVGKPPPWRQLILGSARAAIEPRFILDRKTCGRGSFSVVRRGVESLPSSAPLSLPASDQAAGGGQPQREVAVKLLDKVACIREGRKQAAHQVVREQELLRTLSHRSIIRCVAIIDGGPCSCYIMEMAEGSLEQELARHGGALLDSGPRGTVASILVDIASALVYLHNQQVLHRDIKPDNILLLPATTDPQQGPPRAVLADFGFAVRMGFEPLDDGEEGSSVADEAVPLTAAHSVLGSPQYMAPEVILCGLRGNNNNNYKSMKKQLPRRADSNLLGYAAPADCWALGVTLFRMLSGKQIVPKLSFALMRSWALSPKITWEPAIWSKAGRICSREGMPLPVTICQGMLMLSTQQRLGAKAVLVSATAWRDAVQ